MTDRKKHGLRASSHEYARYDQVAKRDYRLAEQPGETERFLESFEVPTCDLGRYLHGDDGDRRAFAAELGAAMEEIGFAILVGHGLDARLFDEAEARVEDFFTKTPLETKERFRAQRYGAVSEGYFALEETSDIHPDQVEGWVFGRRAFDLDGAADFDARRLWPRPELEPFFRRLVAAELPLFAPILQAVLLHLGADPHHFDDRMARPEFGLRLNYYPPVASAAVARVPGRLLGHEDIDLFTLLPAPSVEGLQALHRSGAWVRLRAPRGSLILNTGDYLQRLSNDVLPSTTHRVSPPRDPALQARSRVSFPLAAYLPAGDVLRVLPGTGEPRYEPIKVITFHTRTTAKFYGDDYAVEEPVDEST